MRSSVPRSRIPARTTDSATTYAERVGQLRGVQSHPEDLALAAFVGIDLYDSANWKL